MSSLWLQGKPGYAYIGLGAGWDDGHVLFCHAKRALRTAGVRHQALPFGSDPFSFPSDAEVESAMRASDAVFLVTALPDNTPGRLDSRLQARLAELLQLEARIAATLRHELAQRRREAPASIRAERPHQLVSIRLPADGTSLVRGYSSAAREALRVLLSDVRRGHGRPEEFDARTDDIAVRIAADLFTHAPHIARADVLLSSTFTGLDDVRERVSRAIAKLNQRVVGDGGAYRPIDFANLPRTTTELAESQRYVDLCTVYLGILGARMGSTRVAAGGAHGSGEASLTTLTEREYEYAGKHGKQRAFLFWDPESSEETRQVGAAESDERSRREAFERQIRADGIPVRVFDDPEVVEWETLDLLGWMNRPSVDQQAYPPPGAEDRRWVYVAHPYVLLDGQTEIARERAARSLTAWGTGEGATRLRTIVALGGMGKSALAWRWFDGLQKTDRRTRSMWWSFYARGSGPEQFAAHALWWMLGVPAVPGTYLERDDARGLYDRVLQELGADKNDYVFVLDGIERTFVCYEHFRGDIAVDEGPGLDLRLRDLARSMVARGAPDETTALRYLRAFSEPGVDSDRALRTGEDRSEFARFLRRVASLPNVRVLLTSRFVPTVVEDLTAGRPPTADVEALRGLAEDEAKALWERHGLPWETSPLPPELGGGTLAELCCRTLQGFALPISILATLVAQQDAAGKSFAAWKRLLPAPLDSAPWCVPVPDGAPTADGLQHMARVQARILVRAIQRLRTDSGVWSVLQRILEEPSGIPYANLRSLVGAPGAALPTERDLWQTLQRLRGWKIVGCSKAMDQYDAHPIVRRALQQSPEDDPHYTEFLRRKREAWAQEDRAAEAGAGLTVAQLEPRWQTILDLLDQGEVFRAYELYASFVESSLRFRTKGAVVRHRREWLDRAIQATDDMKLLRSGGLDYDVLRGLLQCLRADNRLLEGKVAAARSELDSISATALAVGTDAPPQGYSILLLARKLLTLGHVESAGCRLGHAAAAYGGALGWARRLGGMPSLASYAEDLFRWSACGVVETYATIGRIDLVERLSSRLVRRHAPETDTDVASALLAVARDRRSGVREAADRCVRAAQHGDLHFGLLATEVQRVGALLDEADGGGTRADELVAASSAARERAAAGGFRALELEARHHLARARALDGGLSPDEVLDFVAPLRQEHEREGSVAALARILRTESEAHLRARRTDRAIACGREALRHVVAGGPAYADRRLRDALRAVLRAAGDDPEAFEATVAPPPAGPPDPTSGALDEVLDEFARRPGTVTDTKGWDVHDIRSVLEEVKESLDWANTTGSAKKWWEAFENENQHRLALVLRLAEELERRRSTVTEFFLAYVYSNTDNIQANVHYLDYTRLKKQEERRRKEAGAAARSTPEGAPAPTAEDASSRRPFDSLLAEPRGAGVTDARDWPEPAIRERLEAVKATLGWAEASGAAKTWWDELEAANARGLGPVLRLAEELAARKATVAEFHLAFVYSNTGDLLANLHYLDYSRLKTQEEQRKRAAAKEARSRAEAQARLEATTLAQSIRARIASRDPTLVLDDAQRKLLSEHPPEGWSPEELRALAERTGSAPEAPGGESP